MTFATHPRKFTFKYGIFMSAFLVMVVGIHSVVHGQTCSPQELLSIARAGSACINTQVGEACYGSGFVSAENEDGVISTFRQAGDRIQIVEASSISVSAPENSADVSIATLILNTSPRVTDRINLLLINDVQLLNEVAPPNELSFRATGALPIRNAPLTDAPVITELAVNNGVVANGRTREADWLRVRVPATGEIGWASARLVATTGNLLSLPVVTTNEIVEQPFQRLQIQGGGDRLCGDTLHGGALMQTPSTDSEDAVSFSLNYTDVRLAGTAFVTPQEDTLVFVMLDGIAQFRLEQETRIVPAGGQVSILLDMNGQAEALGALTPYEADLFQSLPLNNLPRRFQTVVAQSQAHLEAAVETFIMPSPTPQPEEVIQAPSLDCQRSIARNTQVWSGPGNNFEILREISAGTAINAVLSTNDTQGAEWWQLANSGWVMRSAISQRGDCTAHEIPVVAHVSAPANNTYSLERCESFNGPVRSGQQVTFEFVPPAWDNYGAALNATRTDPGRFILNNQRYRASASAPIQIGSTNDPLEDRHIRRFTWVWTAQPGTYRIIGDWLTYEPSCNLTVPIE